jgi:peptide/nickel transport system ATP-binding protein
LLSDTLATILVSITDVLKGSDCELSQKPLKSQQVAAAAALTAESMQQADEPALRAEPSSARVRGLDIRFPNGVHALRRVDLELRRGEILGLVGESGSGKTLLGLSLLGLTPAEAELTGEAWLGDTEMAGASADERRSARRDHAGAVFQDPMTSLNPTMKVGRQVAEAAGSVEAAEELLGQVGIPDPQRRVHQYPHELSGGLRQRAMIAMAIARDPSVIILDEPTTALDVTLQRGILALLTRLRDDLGAAMLFITHDLAVAAEVADRVAVMYAGRIVEDGTLDEIFYDPQHPYTWGLLGSLTRLDRPRPHRLPQIPGMPPNLLAPPEGCHFRPRCPHAFERCPEVPPLEARLAEAPEHLDRCWLEPPQKRELREVEGRIGLEAPA